MIWPVFYVLAFMEVGVLAFIVKQQLRPLRKVKDPGSAMAKGFTAIVLAFALSVSVCIYAMIGAVMGMPQMAQLGLWAFGLVMLIGSHVWVRGQVRGAMLVAMARSEDAG